MIIRELRYKLRDKLKLNEDLYPKDPHSLSITQVRNLLSRIHQYLPKGYAQKFKFSTQEELFISLEQLFRATLSYLESEADFLTLRDCYKQNMVLPEDVRKRIITPLGKIVTSFKYMDRYKDFYSDQDTLDSLITKTYELILIFRIVSSSTWTATLARLWDLDIDCQEIIRKRGIDVR